MLSSEKGNGSWTCTQPWLFRPTSEAQPAACYLRYTHLFNDDYGHGPNLTIHAQNVRLRRRGSTVFLKPKTSALRETLVQLRSTPSSASWMDAATHPHQRVGRAPRDPFQQCFLWRPRRVEPEERAANQLRSSILGCERGYTAMCRASSRVIKLPISCPQRKSDADSRRACRSIQTTKPCERPCY